LTDILAAVRGDIPRQARHHPGDAGGLFRPLACI
jgi:hypothetical protein